MFRVSFSVYLRLMLERSISNLLLLCPAYYTDADFLLYFIVSAFTGYIDYRLSAIDFLKLLFIPWMQNNDSVRISIEYTCWGGFVCLCDCWHCGHIDFVRFPPVPHEKSMNICKQQQQGSSSIYYLVSVMFYGILYRVGTVFQRCQCSPIHTCTTNQPSA